MVNGKLKKGWEVKKLGDCFKLKSGEALTSKMMTKGIYPVFGGNGIAGLHSSFNLSGSNIIIGRVGALCGNVRHIKEQIWLTDNAFRIVDFTYEFDHSFLTYLLNYKNLREYARQAAQPVISNSSLSDVILEFPKSLAEQQRIVATLDKAFAAIAKAKANAEQNLKNAKELFESYLQSVFANKGKDWEEKPLQEIVHERCTLSYGIVQPGEEYPNGLPVIRPTDLTSKFISLNGLKLIDPKLADSYKRTTLMGNELLLCVRGNTGVISIATEELKGANVTRGIVPICFNPKILKLEFGYYQFISDFIMKQIKGKTYGAALMQINIGDLRKISMLIPTLSEQQVIVKELDSLSSETKKLEAIYQQKINDLDELKKSILQKAFNGELP